MIEVVSSANPPIARLMSFDKYRYEKEKQEKQERKAQKGGEIKQVQISAREAEHDMKRKIQRIGEFFEEDNVVEIVLFLRGREKYNKPWAKQKFDDFLKMIPVEYKTINEPKFGGRGMMAQIAKK